MSKFTSRPLTLFTVRLDSVTRGEARQAVLRAAELSRAAGVEVPGVDLTVGSLIAQVELWPSRLANLELPNSGVKVNVSDSSAMDGLIHDPEDWSSLGDAIGGGKSGVFRHSRTDDVILGAGLSGLFAVDFLPHTLADWFRA